MTDFPLAITYDDIQIVPSHSDVATRKNCSLDTTIADGVQLRVPLTSAPMDTVTGADMLAALAIHGGIGFLHRFMPKAEQASEVVRAREIAKNAGVNAPLFGAAIGTGASEMDRLDVLYDVGVRVILIDVAHGHHENVKRTIGQIRDEYGDKIVIIAGNVTTYEGTEFLIGAGANAIRCGQGSGSACTTRKNTGVGVPQVTAIVDCVKASHDFTGGIVPIIADGGIRYPGDVAKALALGAAAVMCGSLFAGTQESPGTVIKNGTWPNELLFKKFQGSASVDSKLQRGEQEKHIEGVSTMIPYKGSVDRIIDDICDGVRSAMSYVGTTTLHQFRMHARFVRVTTAGMIEGTPHILG